MLRKAGMLKFSCARDQTVVGWIKTLRQGLYVNAIDLDRDWRDAF